MSNEPLRPWLEYLQEIGVRELEVPAGRPSLGAAARSPASGGRRSTKRATTASPRSTKSSASAPSRAAKRPAPAAPGPAQDPERGLRLLRDELGDCTRCKLHSGRTNIVFGVGDPAAGLMFVGEGPGADEDRLGEPFVGRAGKKLDEMIAAIGLSREQVYIANVVKCRPPKNRDPERDEIETCSPFLFRQIEAIGPRVIVTLGSPATRLLLDTRTGITRLRGNWHEFRGVPVMPTFHPAYLLRAYTPENRRKVWEDLKAARSRLED